MSFKKFYESNTREKFIIKKNDRRWTFTQESTGKRYFIKVNDMDIYDSVGAFLNRLDAKVLTDSEEFGYMDHFQFVTGIVQGNKSHIFVKPEVVEKIKGTWVLE